MKRDALKEEGTEEMIDRTYANKNRSSISETHRGSGEYAGGNRIILILSAPTAFLSPSKGQKTALFEKDKTLLSTELTTKKAIFSASPKSQKFWRVKGDLHFGKSVGMKRSNQMRRRQKGKQMERGYLSISETAAYSGISIRTIRKLLNDSLDPIPHHRVGPAGRIIKIRRSDFDAWMDKQRVDIDSIDNIINELT